MKYKANVIKKVTFLLMTMALAVAIVACEGVVGKPGEPGQPGLPGEPGQPGDPGGVPPRIDEAIPDLQLAASGEMATHTIDLNDHFFDPDGAEGEALTFAASSADEAVATAEVSGSTLTLTAVAVGTARITVRATDVDDLTSGADRFDVTVAVTVAPMVTPIPDTMLYEDDGAQTIALSEHFSHKNTITYRVVSVLPAGHVRAEIAEGTLTLTPLVRGAAIVVVEATADDKSITDDFRVEVEPGSKPPPPPPPPPVPTVAPDLTAAIGDMMLYLLDDAKTIDLSEHFAHADEITYTSDVRGDAVDATIAGSMLTLDPVLPGPARVTVTATAGGKSTPETFMVNVKPGSKPVVPKEAPAKLKAIPPQMIYQGDGAKTIDLTAHFSHANDITYETDVRGDAVDATVAGSTLTLDPVLPGSARVTVTAMADGMSSSYSFMVTVKDGTTPPPAPPEAIEKQGTIDGITVEVGKTQTVSVADKFTFTEGVTYDVAASNANAMATVDASGMVSITGKKVGELTLTVTATDARDNEAMQTIAVTVSAMGVLYKPNMVPLAGKGEKQDVSIDEGQTLESQSTGIVKATRKGTSATVWTLEATGKGTAKVRIWTKDRKVEKSITVTVANTDPGVGKEPTTVRTVESTLVDKNGDTVGDGERSYYQLLVNYVVATTADPDVIFTDKDGPDDIVKFEARSGDPNVGIVKTDKAYVVLDVTKKLGSSFTLYVHVVDADEGMSKEVPLTVTLPDPIAEMYTTTQLLNDGDIKTPKIYHREGQTHTLNIEVYGAEADDQYFRFAKVFRTDELADGRLAVPGTAAPGVMKPAAADFTDPPTETSGSYYTVKADGPIELVSTAAAGNGLTWDAGEDPELKFKVTGSGSPKVTITYYVAVCDANAAGDDCATAPNWKWESDYEVLTMNIVPSSSDYKK